jgi:uncharacterized protein (DUF302 family)
MSEIAKTLIVDYHEYGLRHDTFQNLVMTRLPFPEVLDRLRSAIHREGLLVLHEIDPQAILAGSHYVIGEARQLLFFHPRLMARLLTADPSALLEAPLKIAVVLGEEGRISVRWQDPIDSFSRYGVPGLAVFGMELAAVCDLIVATALDTD